MTETLTTPTTTDNLKPGAGSVQRMLGALVKFVEGKIAEAETSLKAREDMEQCWRDGSDRSWRAAGCSMTKEQRLKVSATHGRIAVKQRREVELFKGVLKALKAPNDGTQRSGDAEATNATRATPPGSLE